jgi:glycosyltransferase involved in cell wall biosynthesis
MAADLSLIITTYNRPDALRLVLLGVARQLLGDVLRSEQVEVLIADDGSREDTRTLVQECARDFPFPLHHVWHEDRGFRAGAIRNRAAVRAQGRYLIFVDGDCIPASDFLHRHWQLAEPGWSVAGNRALLSETFTAAISASQSGALLGWSAMDAWRAHRHGDINKTFPLMRLSLGPLRKLGARNWKTFRTCNVGVWRNDFERVNGFDEDFQGWGFEDSDLAVRLLRSGCRIKSGRFAAMVYHLWHRENDRSQQAENWERFLKVLESDHVRARRGLDQYEESYQA